MICGTTLVFSSFSRQHVHVHVLSPQDPFRDHLKGMMQKIHDFVDLPEDVVLRECGTQEYEADVVNLEKQGEGAAAAAGGGETAFALVKSFVFASGVKEHNRVWAQCALHLRKYNDALLINDTLRMVDAYRLLKDFYSSKVDMEIDGTDFFLMQLYCGAYL